MTQRPAAPIVVTSPEGPASLADLVMAWATDQATGRPVHIFELGSDRGGGRCGCICVSCAGPLIAVNAAKATFKLRPHFRHADGVERDQCAVVAARAAVLRRLEEQGLIDLPPRRRAATKVGLSGREYVGRAERPGEQIRIRDVSFRDRAAAILTLEDGRQLRVILTGAVDGDGLVDESGAAIPTILLGVEDRAAAGMSPEELRRRLVLEPDILSWCSHWLDEVLQQQADRAAAAEADLHLDAVPAGLDIPEGLDPALRRQTVLHYEVQRILAASSSLKVPGFVAEVAGTGAEGEPLKARIERPEAALALSSVALEQRAGQVIPDVTCSARAPDGVAFEPLFVEVTVTNAIDEERRSRIRHAVGATGAALEIDVGSLGGTLTRHRLRQIVLEELDGKRWLWRPEMATAAQELQAQLAAQQEASQERADQKAAARDAALQEQRLRARQAEERRALARSRPKPELAAAYLEAFITLQDARKASRAAAGPDATKREGAALSRFSETSVMLQDVGYREAADPRLAGPWGILSRLCSIKLARCVCTSPSHWLDLALDHTLDPGLHRPFFGLYTAAVELYGHELDPERRERFESWKKTLRGLIRERDEKHLRPHDFDLILELVFPELREALASKRMKRLNVLLASPSARRR